MRQTTYATSTAYNGQDTKMTMIPGVPQCSLDLDVKAGMAAESAANARIISGQ